jgi:biopolymer transport protein ExbD
MKARAANLRLRSEINVTPLLDVVLVLLIIFMVITPLMRQGYDVATPGTQVGPAAPGEQIVVSVLRGGSIFINQEEISRSSLSERLSKMLQSRFSPTVFFAADEGVVYGDAVSVMDAIRTSGARIAVAPSPKELGFR